MTTKTSSGAEHRLPLELPTVEYQEDYMLRLINQLRIVFELIPSKQDVEDESSAMSWFMS